MNSADTIILKHLNTLECHDIQIYKYQIKHIMLEYAELYAQKCLEVAATSATTMVWPNIQQGYAPYMETKVDPNSILNIKLPPHE